MKANRRIKDIFKSNNTNVLVINKFNIDDGLFPVTHVVLDGDTLLLYNANPKLSVNFQDDTYEQLLIDNEDKWADIIKAIKTFDKN